MIVIRNFSEKKEDFPANKGLVASGVLAGTGAAMSGASSLVMNEVKHGGKKLLKSPKAKEIVKAAVKKHGTKVLTNSNDVGRALVATGAVVGGASLIKRHRDKKNDNNKD